MTSLLKKVKDIRQYEFSGMTRESQRWGAMRLVPAGVERSTNIAAVPLVHCIDSIAINA